MSEDLIYIRDRRLPYHYTIDNEVYDRERFVCRENGEVKRVKRVYALGVYNSLARHVSYEGEALEQAAIPQRKIAEELEIGVRTVQRALNSLVEAGLLSIETGKDTGEPNLYVLLEVPKAVRKARYARRPKEEGTSGRRTTQEKGTPDKRTPTPDKRTPKLSKTSAGLVFRDNPGEAKKENPPGKEKSLGAHSAQAPHFQNPYKDKAALIQRICDWHDQVAKLSKGGKKYNLDDVRYWATKRLFRVGLERMTQIYEGVALGSNPDIHTFWQKLKAEAKVSRGKVPKFIQDLCGRHPLEVAI